MNTPTVPVAESRALDVREYIGAVRAWLDDLPPEDVDDLTLGMEADLAERAAEGEMRLGEMLGDPGEYAAELRSAAGLPPRSAAVEGPPSPGFWARSVEDFRREAHQRLEDWPWLRELRPTWWLARGGVLAWVVVLVLGIGASWLLVPVGAALSFWWGRRSVGVRRDGAADGASLVVNALAVVLIVPGLAVLVSSSTSGSSEPVPLTGLTVDGAQVRNLFVYDSEGNRVEGARVLDQDGTAVSVDREMLWFYDDVPTASDGLPEVENDVFPLRIGAGDPWSDPESGFTPPLTLPPLPEAASSSGVASPGPTAEPAPSVPEASTPPPTPTPTEG